MQKKHSSRKLLLLEDIRNLGRKGDLVQAKPGFVRNFLLPMKKALVADKQTIRLQETLKKERIAQAAADKKNAEILAKKLKGQTLTMTEKSDSLGHLYGSVTALDIAKLLEKEEGLKIERKNVILLKPIKLVGKYPINLKLSEDVPASFMLIVKGDQVIQEAQSQVEVIDENIDKKSPEDEQSLSEAPSDTNEDKTTFQEEVEERTKN